MLLGTYQGVGTLTTDSLGNGSITVAIPLSSAGSGTLTVDGESRPFTVEAVALKVSVGDSLRAIAGRFTRVWAFDAATQKWLLSDPAAPEVSDLAHLERGKGYWIEVTADSTIVYGGNTYPLRKDWNLSGCLG